MRSSLGVFVLKTVFITSVLCMSNTGAQTDDYTVCGKRLKQDGNTEFIFKASDSDSRNPPGSWPWAVSIGEKSPSKIWNHRCGGSLVSRELVLTAAHCAQDLATKIRAGQLFIRAGDDNLQDASDDADVQVVMVADFVIHPDYTPGPRYFDVGVLKLALPVTLSPTIRTVCLPKMVLSRWEDDGISLTVTGWGTDAQDQSGKSLFDARLQVYPEVSCNLTHEGEQRSQDAIPRGFTWDLLCGGDPAQSEGVCYGDSGSPAVFYSIVEKNYVLKAIVSGGLSCGTELFPNIYVRISDELIIGWIYEVINKELLFNKIQLPILEGETIPETKKRCGGADTCETRETCPFIQNKYDEAQQATGGKRKRMIGSLKSIVCNKQRKAFCCPKSAVLEDTITPEITRSCDGADTCESKETCPYIQNKYVDARQATGEKRKEIVKFLKSMVCNKKRKEFCCPKSENIYVVGGKSVTSDKPLNTVEVFNPILNSWSEAPPMSTPRDGSAVSVFNNELYVIGGYNDQQGVLSSVEKWNPVSGQWSKVSNLNTWRYAAGAAVVAGNLFVLGGSVEVSEDFTLSSVEMYVNNEWNIVSFMPQQYTLPGVVELDGKLYVIGGYDEYYDDYIRVIMFDGVSWRYLQNMNVGIEGPGVAALNGKIYAAGGTLNNTSSQNTVEMFDPVRNEWANVANMNVGRFTPTLVSQGGYLWAFGGMDKNIILLTSFEKYDPVTDEWTIVGDMKSRAGFVGAGVLRH